MSDGKKFVVTLVNVNHSNVDSRAYILLLYRETSMNLPWKRKVAVNAESGIEVPQVGPL